MRAESLLAPRHDIWKKGIPLKEAAYYFAPQILRAQYNEPKLAPRKSTRGMELLAKSLTDENKRQEIIKGFQSLQDFLDITQARTLAEQDMQNRLLERLSNNWLIAYGFTVPRKPADTREQIPTDLFKSEYVKWEKSSINGAGLEFVSVMVFRSKWVREIEALLPKDPHRAIGRPSSKHPITEAIQSLISDRSLPTQSRKNDYELIRAQVHGLFPGEFPRNKGLSDKVIAKYLGPELARPKSIKKSSHKL
jgi:hypothetical protein